MRLGILSAIVRSLRGTCRVRPETENDSDNDDNTDGNENGNNDDNDNGNDNAADGVVVAVPVVPVTSSPEASENASEVVSGGGGWSLRLFRSVPCRFWMQVCLYLLVPRLWMPGTMSWTN